MAEVLFVLEVAAGLAVLGVIGLIAWRLRPRVVASVCAHLGLESDAAARLARPDEAHRCYANLARERIDLGHQQRFCLATAHRRCPFLAASTPRPVGLAEQMRSWWRIVSPVAMALAGRSGRGIAAGSAAAGHACAACLRAAREAAVGQLASARSMHAPAQPDASPFSEREAELLAHEGALTLGTVEHPRRESLLRRMRAQATQMLPARARERHSNQEAATEVQHAAVAARVAEAQPVADVHHPAAAQLVADEQPVAVTPAVADVQHAALAARVAEAQPVAAAQHTAVAPAVAEVQHAAVAARVAVAQPVAAAQPTAEAQPVAELRRVAALALADVQQAAAAQPTAEAQPVAEAQRVADVQCLTAPALADVNHVAAQHLADEQPVAVTPAVADVPHAALAARVAAAQHVVDEQPMAVTPAVADEPPVAEVQRVVAARHLAEVQLAAVAARGAVAQGVVAEAQRGREARARRAVAVVERGGVTAEREPLGARRRGLGWRVLGVARECARAAAALAAFVLAAAWLLGALPVQMTDGLLKQAGLEALPVPAANRLTELVHLTMAGGYDLGSAVPFAIGFLAVFVGMGLLGGEGWTRLWAPAVGLASAWAWSLAPGAGASESAMAIASASAMASASASAYLLPACGAVILGGALSIEWRVLRLD